MIINKWKRNCPECNRIIKYSTKYCFNTAVKKKTSCISCSLIGHIVSDATRKKISKKRIELKLGVGNNNPAKRNDVRKKISKALTGRKRNPFSQSWKENLSNAQKIWRKNHPEDRTGKNSPFYGRHHTEETKRKKRLIAIENINKRSGHPRPNYNPKSISILEEKAKELGITDLQHAENGGEFYIKDLGYWVDGYSKEKNIVIEYYEKRHKTRKDRDERRRLEITEKLKCNFIEIREY